LVSLRTRAGVVAAKLAAASSRGLRRGGGTAVGGLAGLKVAPAMALELASTLGHGSVLVTGTNGKTTTSHLLAAMARTAGWGVVANASGSNLMRGLAGSLAAAAGAAGTVPGARDSLGIFEVDEAVLPAAIEQLRPAAVVFLDLFRDQLDRYGEVDAIAARWREALGRVSPDMTLILNADDPAVASLGENARQSCVYFGVNDAALNLGRVEHAADSINCTCGAAYDYGIAYYGHIGHWRCPNCGRARPATQVTARDVDLADGRRSAFSIGAPGGGMRLEMGLGGLYNVYNALAAIAAALSLGIPDTAVTSALAGAAAAFGRQEAFSIDGRRVEVFLGKNPAGLNQVLSTLSLDPARCAALFALNDGIADGRDVSWIWDADYEVLAHQFEHVIVTGIRADEMALRLKYAEWSEETLVVVDDFAAALDRALEATPPGGCLTVVPTYTAMLVLREMLARRAGTKEYWRS
jgi:UDP-N-acetylmuramyl tripeptide synthase